MLCSKFPCYYYYFEMISYHTRNWLWSSLHWLGATKYICWNTLPKVTSLRNNFTFKLQWLLSYNTTSHILYTKIIPMSLSSSVHQFTSYYITKWDHHYSTKLQLASLLPSPRLSPRSDWKWRNDCETKTLVASINFSRKRCHFQHKNMYINFNHT